MKRISIDYDAKEALHLATLMAALCEEHQHPLINGMLVRLQDKLQEAICTTLTVEEIAELTEYGK